MLTKAEEIKFHLEKAYHMCHTGRPGPVWIDIPANIQNSFIDEKKLIGFKKNLKNTTHTLLDKKIKATAKALCKHDRPLIHLGHGVKLSNCEKIFKKFIKKFSDSVFIPQGAIHRIENHYKNPVKILEIQIGSILKETDIVRYQDIYGRVK